MCCGCGVNLQPVLDSPRRGAHARSPLGSPVRAPHRTRLLADKYGRELDPRLQLLVEGEERRGGAWRCARRCAAACAAELDTH